MQTDTLSGILDLSQLVVEKVAPLELTVFQEFAESYRQESLRVDIERNQNEKADLGFGSGDSVTFLTPWIVYAVKESITFVRELLTGVLVDKAADRKRVPLARSSISDELLRQLKIKVYGELHSKGIKGRQAREIADTVIETVLFDSKGASILFKLLLIDTK